MGATTRRNWSSMRQKLNIAFYGRINTGTDIEVVKKNLVQITKKDRKTINAMFTGKEVILRKDVDRQTAEKFKAAFEKTGAICEIRLVEEEDDLANLTMATTATRQKEVEPQPIPMEPCPNCGFEQHFDTECRQCGIVFQKFIQKEEGKEPAKKTPEPLSEEMQEAVAKAKMIGQLSAMQNRRRYNLRRIFKLTRIGLLASVLIGVAAYSHFTQLRIAGWKETLDVVIYPINGDQTPKTEAYIDMMNVEQFAGVETFMSAEGASYGLPVERPVAVHFAPKITELPPEPPGNKSSLAAIWWSLQMRYWAFRHDTYEDSSDIRIYVIYKALNDKQPKMELSVGLRKALIGIVNSSPDENSDSYTNIVIVHELLHTLGASDKYDYGALAPVYPDGYADPYKDPLYPQFRGEIMAVRIPTSKSAFSMPASLNNLVIGEKTCLEIQWCKKEDNQKATQGDP
jgi:hypothetical protein